MHFYWLLLMQAWQITLDWMALYSLGTRAAFAILFGLVSWGALERVLFGDSKIPMLKRMARLIVEVVFAPLVIIGAMFVISVVYYAPSALLQETATNAATKAGTSADKGCRQQLADSYSRFEACRAGYNDLLNILRYPNPNKTDLDEIIRERQLLKDARTKNDPTAYSFHTALDSAFETYRREHPNPCGPEK